MAKKIFIISLIVFVVAGGVFAAISFGLDLGKKEIEISQKNQENDENENLIPKTEDKKEEKQASKNKIEKVIEGDVYGASIDAFDNLFFQNGKNILKGNNQGKSAFSLATHPFEKIERIIWSQDKTKVIVKDGNSFYLIYLDQGKVEKLKEGVDWAIFNFNGNKLIYKYYQASTKKRSINISELDGENWKELGEVEYKDLEIDSFVSLEKFIYFPKPDAFFETKLALYDYKEEKEEKIFQGKTGADFLLSPKNDKILVSFTLENDKSKLSLAVMNANGGQFVGLNFPSSVRKCVWSKDNINIYCARMGNFPSQAVLPNDWESNKYNFADTFWKINTQTGEQERFLETDEIGGEYDGINFFFDENEKNLFFINKKDQDLYRISL